MPHIHELYDFTVTFFIVYNGKVLLVHHPRYGKWIPPGGHIELNEDPEQALYREIAEETGLEVEILASKPKLTSTDTKFILTPNYIDVHEANPPHRHIALTYFARAKSPHFVKSDEHIELKWFTPMELHDSRYNLSDSVKFYAVNAMAAEAKSHAR
ncbi:MAG TPA: NUDIX domain-containing protein [Candidatus Saccharimonadales bacterium]|nr:NUDIX domain-containing protein [Candidatus Saccharimonadales bacterium]